MAVIACAFKQCLSGTDPVFYLAPYKSYIKKDFDGKIFFLVGLFLCFFNNEKSQKLYKSNLRKMCEPINYR